MLWLLKSIVGAHFVIGTFYLNVELNTRTFSGMGLSKGVLKINSYLA